MTPRKETQVEDSTVTKVETPVTPQPKPEEKPKKTFLQIALPWVIVAVVFFLGGLSTLYFTAYRTTKAELAAAKASAAELSDQLSAAEVNLQKATTDLTDTQADLESTAANLTKSQTLAILYKFQADVNAVRASILNQDPSSARQTLTFVSADLAALQKTGIDAESLAGLQPRIDTALENLESEPQKSLEALDTLYTNLTLITSNFE